MDPHKSDLQVLHWLRHEQEKQALREYGLALKSQENALNRLESMQQDLEEARIFLEMRYKAGCSAEELSRLKSRCDTIHQRCLASEYAVKTARNQTRLAFTKLLATRHVSAVIKKWNGQSSETFSFSHADPAPPTLEPAVLDMLARTTETSLWN